MNDLCICEWTLSFEHIVYYVFIVQFSYFKHVILLHGTYTMVTSYFMGLFMDEYGPILTVAL